jgi:hypothetical protein
VRRGDQSGSWIVSIARPLKDRAGRFVAVLAAGTWLERFQQALRMQGLPAGSIVTIVDQKGIVVSRSVDAGNWIGSDVSNWRGAEKHFAVQEGSQITPWASDGIERITAFSRLHRAWWLVNIGQPTNAAFAAVATRPAWSVAFIIGTLISRLQHRLGAFRTRHPAAASARKGRFAARVRRVEPSQRGAFAGRAR